MSDDSIEMTDCLKTAKSALEQHLIETNDYDQVKAAFLRAQQIRAGLDAGFIRQDDYDQIKQTFLQSLQGMSVNPSSFQHTDQMSASRVDQQQAAPAAAPTQLHASQSSRQTNRQPSFTSAAPSNSSAHGPAHVPAPAPAPAAPAGPVTAGGANIPADIPKMGGNRPKQPQGVSLLCHGFLIAGIITDRSSTMLPSVSRAADIHEWYSSWRGCCEPVLLHEGQVSGRCHD